MRRLSCLNRALAVLILLMGLTAPIPLLAQDAGDLLAVVNAERARAGCKPLAVNKKLMAAAQVHAKAMAQKNFFSHTGKDGSKPATRVTRQGYAFRHLAENIAAGQSSAKQVLGSWLQSAPHRRNIKDCSLTETGVAVVYQSDDKPIMGNGQAFYYYWVQLFAKP